MYYNAQSPIVRAMLERAFTSNTAPVYSFAQGMARVGEQMLNAVMLKSFQKEEDKKANQKANDLVDVYTNLINPPSELPTDWTSGQNVAMPDANATVTTGTGAPVTLTQAATPSAQMPPQFDAAPQDATMPTAPVATDKGTVTLSNTPSSSKKDVGAFLKNIQDPETRREVASMMIAQHFKNQELDRAAEIAFDKNRTDLLKFAANQKNQAEDRFSREKIAEQQWLSRQRIAEMRASQNKKVPSDKQDTFFDSQKNWSQLYGSLQETETNPYGGLTPQTINNMSGMSARLERDILSKYGDKTSDLRAFRNATQESIYRIMMGQVTKQKDKDDNDSMVFNSQGVDYRDFLAKVEKTLGIVDFTGQQ